MVSTLIKSKAGASKPDWTSAQAQWMMSSISLGTGPIVPRALPAWMMSCANSNVVRDDAKWQKEKREGGEEEGERQREAKRELL